MDSFKEGRERVATAIGRLRAELSEEGWSQGQIDAILFESFIPNWRIPEILYEPDRQLLARLDDYAAWCEGEQDEDKGELMEELALLAFRCLEGVDRLESYQSYAEQMDLVVSGNSSLWYLLMEFLHLPKSGRTVVIEAKNLDQRVTHSQFSRLCSIVQTKFTETCHLAVFFTRNGATGFQYTRVLRDSRSQQVIFKAQTNKSVIVLDDQDIRQLGRRGALPIILERKISDLEAGSNVPSQYGGPWHKIVNLPRHLARHFSDSIRPDEEE